MSLKPHGFASNLAPGSLDKFGPLCQEAGTKACKCMISTSIRMAAATRFRSAPAAAGCERELEPEPAAQRDLHYLRVSEVWGSLGIAWSHAAACEPAWERKSARWEGGKEGSSMWSQKKRFRVCARRTVLPSMPPFTGLGNRVRPVRWASSLLHELPGRYVRPSPNL